MMKKYLFTALICAFAASQIQAQDFGFGLKGGLSYATVSGSDIKDIDPTFKYHAGITLRWGITKAVFFQPEVLYSVKGFSANEVDVDFGYVDIPLLIKVKLGDIISLHVGPQFGYMLSADQTRGSSESDVIDRYKDYDLSAAFGAEYEAVLGLSIGLRYTYGITSIGEEYEESASTFVNGQSITTKTKVEAPDVKNGVAQLFIAYTF